MGAVEIIKALVSPVNKFIDVVHSGVGKWYEPIHVRRMAKAKAFEFKTVGETVCENSL